MRPLPLLLAAVIGVVAAVALLPRPSTHFDAPVVAPRPLPVAVVARDEPPIPLRASTAARASDPTPEAEPEVADRTPAGVVTRTSSAAPDEEELAARREARVAARERLRERIAELEEQGEAPPMLLERTVRASKKMGTAP